jgi:hypothetical protein
MNKENDMKDYTVTITITMSIRARNEEQAEERAATTEDEAMNGLKAHPWAGDAECEALVEGDE